MVLTYAAGTRGLRAAASGRARDRSHEARLQREKRKSWSACAPGVSETLERVSDHEPERDLGKGAAHYSSERSMSSVMNWYSVT